MTDEVCGLIHSGICAGVAGLQLPLPVNDDRHAAGHGRQALRTDPGAERRWLTVCPIRAVSTNPGAQPKQVSCSDGGAAVADQQEEKILAMAREKHTVRADPRHAAYMALREELQQAL
ncbi:MAG: hypothetical protein IPG64_11600 [Haliea sp.]|nr:hypothetical protein [Haliea sp.]